MAARLSSNIKSLAAERYRRMVDDARERKEIRVDADAALTSFCLDALFTMVQFSFGSAYYRERLALFLGKPALARSEAVIEGVLDFIRRSLAPR